MTTTTGPRRDQFGVTHRRHCTTPGYGAITTTLPGVLLLRCQACDAQRLTPANTR